MQLNYNGITKVLTDTVLKVSNFACDFLHLRWDDKFLGNNAASIIIQKERFFKNKISMKTAFYGLDTEPGPEWQLNRKQNRNFTKVCTLTVTFPSRNRNQKK